jgi:succinate dehydrogenase / fumarate reductase membrane anchor subunit
MSWRASGLKAWAWQRLTAVYLVLYLLITLVCVVGNAPLGFTAWRGAFASPLVSLSTALAIACLLLHAWVGVRDIVMDYLHPPVLRIGALGGLALFLSLMGLWALFILARSYS